MYKIHHIDHPILKHALTVLRNKNTATEEFRRHTAIISQIMIMEATRNLSTMQVPVETPLAKTKGSQIGQAIVLVPVLRAGISMLFAAKDFLPWAPVGFIGLERDEETAVARQYYQKFPSDLTNKLVLILDPMLATGGSLLDTVEALQQKGAVELAVVCIVAAPEGIERLKNVHPDIHIYTADIDSNLNRSKFIVPGLGDFGDRYFGT